MAEHIPSQITVSLEEALRTEIIINQALIDILIAKQIISEDELVISIQKVRQEQKKLIDGSRKIFSLQRETQRGKR